MYVCLCLLSVPKDLEIKAKVAKKNKERLKIILLLNYNIGSISQCKIKKDAKLYEAT